MAQSLVQIVLLRVLQGLFGAALVPLSQTTLLNINPKERQGSAMALWGVAVMAGPVLGPVLGGWLTSAYSWRYVFYINLPIGILAFFGITTSCPTARNVTAKLDWFGFGTLSLSIAATQLVLDRGEELDWFGSGEIVTEAMVAASALPAMRDPIMRSRSAASPAHGRCRQDDRVIHEILKIGGLQRQRGVIGEADDQDEENTSREVAVAEQRGPNEGLARGEGMDEEQIECR